MTDFVFDHPYAPPPTDATRRAIVAWVEDIQRSCELTATLNAQITRLGMILTELRQQPELTARVDQLTTKHGMDLQWDVLQWYLNRQEGEA